MNADVARALECPVCGSAATEERMFGSGLLRCGRCRFLFADPATLPEPVQLYDNEYFAGYDDVDYRAAEPQRRHESRVRLARVAEAAPPPARLLEIGSAAGFFLDEARTCGYVVTGVEPNALMAAHARERLDLDVYTGIVEYAPLADAAFDVACAWHVIEHVGDPVAVLKRVRAAIRPGGHLFVEVPNVESATARRQGAAWPALELPYHVGHHGPGSMRALLERAGFEVVRIDTLPFAAYVRWPRPEAAFRVAAAAREALRARALLPSGADPTRHQLLSAIGRRPPA